MGKGLSPLQRDILAVLHEWPSWAEARPHYIGDWARPVQIISRLGLPVTMATRVAVSRALLRLCQRELVVRASGEILSVGKGYRYARVS